MRVCIFVSNDLTNDPRVARHAGTLGKFGHNVLVICFKSPRTVRFEKRDAYRVHRCDPCIVVRTLMAGRKSISDDNGTDSRLDPYSAFVERLTGSLTYMLRILDMNYQFARVARDFNAHIYTSNDLDTLLAGVLSAGLSRKLVYDTHELWPDMFSSPKMAWLRIIEYFLVKRVTAIITVNEFISGELQRRYHAHIPYVVLNTPKMMPPNEHRRYRPHAKKLALYHGLFDRHRGLENLVRACEYLREDVNLIVRGYGELEDELRRIAKPYRNCRFPGPVPPGQLVSAAASADIGVVSYLPVNMNNYLASPNKLFEYIQAGLPVVASDLPYLRRIVTENKIGYLFDPRDPKDIANAINLVTRDKTLMALRSRVLKIQRRYSWEEEGKKLLQVYNECLLQEERGRS